MIKLKDRSCSSCDTEVLPLTKEDLDKYLLELDNGWEINDGFLQKKFKFPNFNDGLKFANEIGKICDREKHHPILHLSWAKVIVLLKTVKTDSLSINDFILAAKIDNIK